MVRAASHGDVVDDGRPLVRAERRGPVPPAALPARARDEAWREYAALPRFRRQHERPYAWRIRPWRPALVAVALALAAALLLRSVLPGPSQPRPTAADAQDEHN